MLSKLATGKALDNLAHSELAEQPIAAAAEALRCKHWRGCGLALQPAVYPAGPPLISLVDQEDTMIEIGCRTCGGAALRTPEQVIRQMRGAGTGDGKTGLNELGDLIRGPCRKCGGTRFYAGAAPVPQPRERPHNGNGVSRPLA